VSEVVRLKPDDAERYVRLRRRMLADAPWAYSADPETDSALDPSRVAANLANGENGILAVGYGGYLVAALGVARNREVKLAERAIVWGVFVEPSHRGKGYGAALLDRAIELARGWPGIDYIDLSVSGGSPAARSLYERFGFVAWGTESEATQIDGRRYDEHHMTLRLEKAR